MLYVVVVLIILCAGTCLSLNHERELSCTTITATATQLVGRWIGVRRM